MKDFFWWVFENNWQPNADDQQKLFCRVTQNYVHLLSSVKHPYYEETFLKVIFTRVLIVFTLSAFKCLSVMSFVKLLLK